MACTRCVIMIMAFPADYGKTGYAQSITVDEVSSLPARDGK
jgi:hypothetical protein